MKDIETLKQEAKEDKEFCTIKTKKLKGLLNEIDRLTTYSRKLLDENIDLSNETNRLKARLEEGEKYKAFWEQSREADKMTFEKYVWNTIHAKPLPEDMNKVLHDNLNDLYEK